MPRKLAPAFAPALLTFALLAFALTAFVPAGAAFASAADNNVEWNGVSHMGWLDRDPRCPVDRQSFTVSFQAYRSDLTSARVSVDDGAQQWVDAAVTGSRGPYDIWSAVVPASDADQLTYWFELRDGADIDYLSAGGVTDGTPVDGGFAVDFATLEHAPVGATPLPGGGTVFKVWAPTRTTAHVRGEFNGWGTANALTKVGEYFVGRVPAAAAGQMYKYWFNSSHWNTDARAKSVIPTDNYNAKIVDPGAYQWQVTDFTPPPFEEMVIYQLHVGTFAGRNDPFGLAPFPSRYVDVAARAAHLAELGVNAVMLNPINEFPGDLSAGYNPVSQWAPEWKYGTPDELRAMIDELHAHGIAVLLDIVWNHFSSTDNFLWNYDGTQTYFDTPAVPTPWGDQADFDNAAVRDYFAESAWLWLDEFRFDGFRMDATDFMNIDEHASSGWTLMQRLNDEMDNRAADKIAIAEQLPDDSWVTRPTNQGGAGFDTQYYDHFTDRLREQILAAALGDPNMSVIRDIIYGSGEYLFSRYVTNYVELHDEAWPSSGGQRIVKTIDTTAPYDDEYAQGRYKLAQGLVLTAPGIPAMLMGSEWLEDTDFGTDFGNRIDWGHKTTYAPVFAWFRDMIALRTTSPGLRANAGVSVFHLNEGANVLAFQRYDLSGNVHVIVANFSNDDFASYRIGLPVEGAWTESVNSQDPLYGGDGPVNAGGFSTESIAADGFARSAAIAVPAMGLLVLSPGGTSAVGDDLPDADGVRLLDAYPNPFNPRVTIAYAVPWAAHVTVTVHDVAGRLVRTLVAGRHEAGERRVTWNGVDDGGAEVASGVYFARIVSGGAQESRKLMLVR
jgi:1,4-alpha-glucan branching enzyme